MHLDSLKLSDTLPTKVGFDLGSGLKLVVEPHAPGVFRVRVGKAESVAGDILPGTRAKVHADYLLARPEAVSEMQVEPLENTTTGWRLTQG